MVAIWNFLENIFGFMGAYAVCIFGCGLCGFGAFTLIIKIICQYYGWNEENESF